MGGDIRIIVVLLGWGLNIMGGCASVIIIIYFFIFGKTDKMVINNGWIMLYLFLC